MCVCGGGTWFSSISNWGRRTAAKPTPGRQKGRAAMLQKTPKPPWESLLGCSPTWKVTFVYSSPHVSLSHGTTRKVVKLTYCVATKTFYVIFTELGHQHKMLKGLDLDFLREFSNRERLSVSWSDLYSLCRIKRSWSVADFHVVKQGQEEHIVYFLHSQSCLWLSDSRFMTNDIWVSLAASHS